jgi:hypothetical protein
MNKQAIKTPRDACQSTSRCQNIETALLFYTSNNAKAGPYTMKYIPEI